MEGVHGKCLHMDSRDMSLHKSQMQKYNPQLRLLSGTLFKSARLRDFSFLFYLCTMSLLVASILHHTLTFLKVTEPCEHDFQSRESLKFSVWSCPKTIQEVNPLKRAKLD